MRFYKYLKEDVISPKDAIAIFGGPLNLIKYYSTAESAYEAIVGYLVRLRTIHYPEGMDLQGLKNELDLIYKTDSG